MARRASLSWLFLALVLLAHWAALEWVARLVIAQPAMRLLAPPMFTRLLQPREPLPVLASEVKMPGARSPRTFHATKNIVSSVPASATPSVAGVPQVATVASSEASPVAAAPPAAATPVASLTATAASAPGTPTAALDSWPADTRLNYRVGGQYRGELHGDARVQWQRQGDRYQTRVDISLGLVSFYMTSQGEVTPQGLRPRAYEEERGGKRRSAQLDDAAIILSDGRWIPRPDGVQDTASQFVELSHRFANGLEPLEVGRSVSFWLARPGGADLWTYDVIERETLQTPRLGPVDAFHLKPRPLANPRGNIVAEMWFAPSLQYLPVRIRVSMGEAIYVDLLEERIEQR